MRAKVLSITLASAAAALVGLALLRKEPSPDYLPKGTRIVQTFKGTYGFFPGPKADKVWEKLKPKLLAKGGKPDGGIVISIILQEDIQMPDGTKISWSTVRYTFPDGTKFEGDQDGMILAELRPDPTFAFMRRLWPF